jgi:hypothetical protein
MTCRTHVQQGDDDVACVLLIAKQWCLIVKHEHAVSHNYAILLLQTVVASLEAQFAEYLLPTAAKEMRAVAAASPAARFST